MNAKKLIVFLSHGRATIAAKQIERPCSVYIDPRTALLSVAGMSGASPNINVVSLAARALRLSEYFFFRPPRTSFGVLLIAHDQVD